MIGVQQIVHRLDVTAAKYRTGHGQHRRGLIPIPQPLVPNLLSNPEISPPTLWQTADRMNQRFRNIDGSSPLGFEVPGTRQVNQYLENRQCEGL